MSIATADLAAQTTEILTGLLATLRPGPRRNLVIDLLVDRAAIDTPTAFAELMIDDIVTFGSRRSEWVVAESGEQVIAVRQIKGSQIDRTDLLFAAGARVWRAL